MKDKQEEFEWAKRGKDLENIHKIIESHKTQLLVSPGTELCYLQIRVILDQYMDRCTPAFTRRDRRKYQENKNKLLTAEGVELE